MFQYSHYEPVSAFETRMPVGMLQRFALPGGRELELQPLGIRPPVVRILARVKRGVVGEIATVMDVPPRRPALIGGLPHESGVLIIAIRANSPTPESPHLGSRARRVGLDHRATIPAVSLLAMTGRYVPKAVRHGPPPMQVARILR